MDSQAGAAELPGDGEERWPRRVRASIRQLLGFGVMRASSRLRNASRSGEPVYARTRLASARIEEGYSYYQEISQNGVSRQLDEPTGLIELVLPYDGDRYFTRQAYSDVMRAHQLGADAREQALVGHLAFTDYEHTDLDDLLSGGPTDDSLPIRVPLCFPPGPFAASLLVADSRTCVLSHQYRPSIRHLEVPPVDVGLKLDDPDTAEFTPPQAPEDFEGRRLQIMRHVSFHPGLRLRMEVRMNIPRAMAEGALPEVSDVLINWPTHTSLRSLALDVGGQQHPIRYNPRRNGLEWSGIPMTPDPEPASGDFHTFRTPEMCLSIPQPGELYQEDNLDGMVEVKLDRLLSGMDARLYDATGKPRGHPQPELESRISTKFSLILDDAFARRTLSLSQQLHFDEVIPSQMRIDDIKTALRGLGFKVQDPWPESAEDRWLLAERAEGPDPLRLYLYIVGQRHKARRDRRIPGGITYRTELDSGELWIYIYGTLPRESQPVVQQMNALHQALHERFIRLPARR
jgi:hypothetical protein